MIQQKPNVRLVRSQPSCSGQPQLREKDKQTLRADSTTCYAPLTTNNDRTFKGAQRSCLFVYFLIFRHNNGYLLITS